MLDQRSVIDLACVVRMVAVVAVRLARVGRIGVGDSHAGGMSERLIEEPDGEKGFAAGENTHHYVALFLKKP